MIPKIICHIMSSVDGRLLPGRWTQPYDGTSSSVLFKDYAEKLTATVDELRRQIASLEDVIKGKSTELSKENPHEAGSRQRPNRRTAGIP